VNRVSSSVGVVVKRSAFWSKGSEFKSAFTLLKFKIKKSVNGEDKKGLVKDDPLMYHS